MSCLVWKVLPQFLLSCPACDAFCPAVGKNASIPDYHAAFCQNLTRSICYWSSRGKVQHDVCLFVRNANGINLLQHGVALLKLLPHSLCVTRAEGAGSQLELHTMHYDFIIVAVVQNMNIAPVLVRKFFQWHCDHAVEVRLVHSKLICVTALDDQAGGSCFQWLAFSALGFLVGNSWFDNV